MTDTVSIYKLIIILETPMEKIMEALNDLVWQGKVRYIGASSIPAWQFQKLNNIAEHRG